jgi:recombination protein RecT
MQNQNLPAKRPIDLLKNIVNSESVQARLKAALDDNAGIFTMSVIDLYASDTYLQKCDPNLVVAECMKAASLKLPVAKSLGFAYIVPFKEKGVPKPQFLIGYKGMIQLAMRTGQFRYLNADAIYEGEEPLIDRLTGELTISGKAESTKEIGYFAFMELTNGFKKAVYMTKEEVIAHAKKYSKSYGNKYSAWVTSPGSMERKTPLRKLLSTWAPMSIDFVGGEMDEESNKTTGDEPEIIDGDFETIDDDPETGQGEGKQPETEADPY